ncbi:MAG TPA: hypothetical protein VGM88_21495 [Kofleriaceae bacterium]|jgi:hypothetical protein
MGEPADPDDLEAGVHFVHDLAMNALGTADRTEQLLTAIIDVLAARGVIDPAELAPAMTARQGYQPPLRAAISPVVDKRSVASPDIDCQALLPICEARCCRLAVHLSYEDVQDGLRWVFERPYELRRDGPDGHCGYYDHGCTVYEERPGTCRSFDCRYDPRIWLDYDAKIPAPKEPLVQIRRR